MLFIVWHLLPGFLTKAWKQRLGQFITGIFFCFSMMHKLGVYPKHHAMKVKMLAVKRHRIHLFFPIGRKNNLFQPQNSRAFFTFLNYLLPAKNLNIPLLQFFNRIIRCTRS